MDHGYSGVILSTDDYFTDRNLNKYVYDLNKLDDAHRYNRRRGLLDFLIEDAREFASYL